MNFARSLQTRRRWANKRRRKTGSLTLSSRGILTCLAICTSVGAAGANPGVPIGECRLVTIAAEPCPATRRFEALLDYRPDIPILNIRPAAASLDDIAGGIPEFRFDIAPPRPVALDFGFIALSDGKPVSVLGSNVRGHAFPESAPKPASLTPPDPVEIASAPTEPAEEAAAPTMIVGIASTYNPMNPADKHAGGLQTASGEMYDPEAWTAAIQLDLRDRFGGVRYGRNYRPSYALVESGDRRLIVRINDVGPLKPGRIIDLNERAMRFFDPSLRLGLIHGVRVSPLEGTQWTAGPVDAANEIMMLAAASSHSRR